MGGLLIVGAGGHGKVVADIAHQLGRWSEIAFVDDLYPDSTLVGEWKVIGKTTEATRFRAAYPEAIVAIGANTLRLNMQKRLFDAGFKFPILIHPDASVSRLAFIGAGTVICSQAAVIIDARIGLGVIVNTGASIGHDCALGDGVHVAPGVRLAGGVSIGECSWIGIGAIVKERVSIGCGVIVGAGSTIIRDIQDEVTVVGSPGKIISHHHPKKAFRAPSQSMRILDIESPSDFNQWLELWQRWPGREVAAHPAYVRLFTRPQERAVCAVSECDQGGILFPLILRPLAAEPWTSEHEEVWDAATPYGYGGPFTWGAEHLDVNQFWNEFSAWAKNQKIISTFTRLSLFPEQILPLPVKTVIDRRNIVRPLQVDEPTMWMEFAHKVRKNVNRARQLGVEIRIDHEGLELDSFLEIYEETMGRRNASHGYFFGREFFETMLRDLRGQYVFFHSVLQGQVVSSELVLVSEHHLYSFLGGTRSEFFQVRPNDLLKHAIIEWGRDMGKTMFVLGGGWQEDDGIFNYKVAFSPKGVVDFRVGKWVQNLEDYVRLMALRREWESDQGNAWIPKDGFFPEYRG